ncbi:Co2+/Mg2+ efflux protein ApaG [Pseudomarimonas salicorniae]|uniref:Protein ApaG n=1 Tax=Pseudomarimonas salicorniae TaxID=2933270 RepID=A0ABT0GDD4_9GAMM|nr:Co2+/Mg2+ efflux protein ApaG [Lysobacter sp. CAU 1642]MCK7592552.1 Co2+/Mg2+ efflux protein ApaG [Lysobacter sp. CAU 1642]
MNAPRYRVAVEARSRYLADQSDPDEARYVFAYTIRLRNEGAVSAQLLERHWIITDADGGVEEVRGEGVVGKQPVLAPGESFEYSSGAVLKTAVGSMQGSYAMHAADGTEFEAPIAPFTLSVPRSLN